MDVQFAWTCRNEKIGGGKGRQFPPRQLLFFNLNKGYGYWWYIHTGKVKSNTGSLQVLHLGTNIKHNNKRKTPIYIFLQAVLPHTTPPTHTHTHKHTHNSVNHEAYSFTLRCFLNLWYVACFNTYWGSCYINSNTQTLHIQHPLAYYRLLTYEPHSHIILYITKVLPFFVVILLHV
jgi:hypothetical protein